MSEKRRFILPPEVKTVRDAFCFQNAINALIIIAKKEKNLDLPQIYEIDTPKGPHAYFVYKNHVFNKGVTWVNDHYPDYSLDQIQNLGKDVTRDLIEQILDIQEDYHGYRRFVERNFGQEGISFIRNLYSLHFNN